MEGRNRYADLESRLVDTVGEREGGMNRDSSIDIYTLPCEIDGQWEAAL